MNMLKRNVSLDRMLDIIDTTPYDLISKLKYDNEEMSISSSNIIYHITCDYNREYTKNILMKEILKIVQLHEVNTQHDFFLTIISNEILSKIGFDLTNYNVFNNVTRYYKQLDCNIDYDIIDTINILNKNKYKTYFSCSGHYMSKDISENLYITFRHTKRLIPLIHYIVNKLSDNDCFDVYTRLSYIAPNNIPVISLYITIDSSCLDNNSYTKLNVDLFYLIEEYIKNL